jgi:hypothetical protein
MKEFNKTIKTIFAAAGIIVKPPLAEVVVRGR